MKQITTAACCTIIGCAASLWAASGSEADLNDKVKPLADAVRLAMTSGGPSGLWMRSIIKENDIPKNAYIATLESLAEAYIADTVVRTNYEGRVVDVFRMGTAVPTLISAIGSLGDSEFLPWLEQQAMESRRPDVREYSAISYVKIAGLDAIPFVRKILTGSREKYDFHCRNLVSKEFFDQIAKAEAVKAPQEKIDAAYAMLVEQAQTVAYVGHADEIDKFLCERLQGYRASVQREKVVERFVNSTNEIARTNFGKKRDEIQKTPKAERIDLRTRFPGLAVPKTGEGTRLESSSEQEIAE